MRACLGTFAAALVAGSLVVVLTPEASASPVKTAVQLPTGSTTPLPGTRVPTANLDGWVTLMARGGVFSGGGTGFEGSVEFLFLETMGLGYGYMAADDSTSYLRLTYAMLDVKYWLWAGYVDFLSDVDGVIFGTSLSVPVHKSNNIFLRFSIGIQTETDDKIFGAGLEVAVW